MNKKMTNQKLVLLMLAGLLGSLFMAASDWLMIYGNTAYEGDLAWLTEGTAQISGGRNALAMGLAFPAVILYCLALLSVRYFYKKENPGRIYAGLTALGMTPWLCLHLLYTMILFLFAWLTGKGQPELALEAGEALFGHFGWIVPVAEVLMLLPFLYFFVTILMRKTVFPRRMALNNPLILYVLLKLITLALPDTPFRLAFTNGLMSEAMAIWFVILAVSVTRYRKLQKPGVPEKKKK